MAKKDLSALIQELGGKVIQKVVLRTLNKAATSVRTEASKRIRERVKLKAKDVKDAIVVMKATRAQVSLMRSSVLAMAKPVDLYKFGARARTVKTEGGKRIGVTVNITGKRKLVRGGFIARMKSGKVGVFRRGGKRGAYRPRSKRLPIKLLFSTTVQQAFSGKETQAALVAFAQKRVAVIFDQEAKYELSKLGKGGN